MSCSLKLMLRAALAVIFIVCGDAISDAISQEQGAASPASNSQSASQQQNASASVIAPNEDKVAYVNGFTDFDPKAKPYAYVASAAIWQWPQGVPKIIYVCWENPTQQHSAEQALVQQAVAETWQAYSQLRFEGWQACVPGNYGIHIRIDDSGPHTKGLGRQLDRKQDGMVLNFTFNNWSPTCKENEARRKSCIYTIAVHEFGHAIGYAHEQNRFDAPGECQELRQGNNGDLLLTSYDPDSVMNYCNERYNNDGRLSERDRLALAAIYGAP